MFTLGVAPPIWCHASFRNSETTRYATVFLILFIGFRGNSDTMGTSAWHVISSGGGSGICLFYRYRELMYSAVQAGSGSSLFIVLFSLIIITSFL